MSLPLLIAILAVNFFGGLAIVYSLREEKTRKKLKALEALQKRLNAQESILGEIYHTLDHTLDIKPIMQVLTRNLHGLIPFTTVSTIIVKDHKLDFTVFAAEPVHHAYIDELKSSMLQHLTKFEKRNVEDAVVTEETIGDIFEHTTQTIQSQIHLPVKIHESVVAIITVTSSKPDAFTNEAAEMLENIIDQTSEQISRLDATLQVEKSRVTAMIQSLQDGLFMVDTHNKLQIINPAAKQMLGLREGHPNTMDVLSSLPIHFDFAGKMQRALHQNLSSSIEGVTMKNKTYNFSITPVRDSNDKPLGVCIVMKDETLTNALPRMKEDFTNIIVHELRSPLTSIKASSELLISPTQFTPEEQHKLIHLIYEQSNKLLGEVAQILDAAKLEAGVFIIHKNQADLKDVIKEATTIFLPQVQERMINLVVEVDPLLPKFSFDTYQISQSLTNLLSNSIKFTPTGGTIKLSAKQDKDKVVITVSDTGSGIPKEKQEKLFTKFGQIEAGSANVGTGLGLYLVKGIIEAHGGTVSLKSDKGEGTTITLTLPMQAMVHPTLPVAPTLQPSNKIVN